NLANNVTGTITVTGGGTLELTTSGRIGSTSAGAGNVVIDNGTLKVDDPSTGNSFLSSNKTIIIGNGSGMATVNVPTSGIALLYHGTRTATGGTTSSGGSGTLIKTGAGEFRYQGAATANSSFAKLVVNQGLFRMGNVAGNNFETFLGAVPT